MQCARGEPHLDDLPVHVQHVHGDLHVPGDALPAFLKLAFLQGDIKVVPHLSCGDNVTLSVQAGIIHEPSTARTN